MEKVQVLTSLVWRKRTISREKNLLNIYYAGDENWHFAMKK